MTATSVGTQFTSSAWFPRFRVLGRGSVWLAAYDGEADTNYGIVTGLRRDEEWRAGELWVVLR